MDIRKRISPKEFRELGYLQELNRVFLHPLGMALQIQVDTKTGNEYFGGVLDCREDPEGVFFNREDICSKDFANKAIYVACESLRRAPFRRSVEGQFFKAMPNEDGTAKCKATLGYMGYAPSGIQPLDWYPGGMGEVTPSKEHPV